jgi:ribonuclease HI
MKLKKAIIHVDGASKGNPGAAAIGATIKDEQGQLIACISQRIGHATNNQAEYRAVIAALEKATRLGADDIELYSDSELVVKQLRGEYRVKKAALKPLYDEVRELLSQLESYRTIYIPRNQNMEAHNLANKAFNPVPDLPSTGDYKLIIKVIQTGNRASDIALLHGLIDAIRDFPGEGEVRLKVVDKGREKVVEFKLLHMHINYCLEARKRLVQLVGKKKLKVELVSSGLT